MSLFWKTAGYVLPYRLFNFLQDRRTRQIEVQNFERDCGHLQRLAAPNLRFKNRHPRSRAFVLCNGPTTLKQDLAPLAEEIVFSVSTGYLHPSYDKIKPRYHCVPQITYSAQVTEKDVIALFTEMHQRTGDAELFLSSTEEKLVRENGLFPGRTIHYVFLYENFDHLAARAIPDLSTAVPGVQSVPIMAIMIALYMGMTNIYLLGTEHSEFVTKRYEYSFQPTVLKGKDLSTTASGEIVSRRYDDFHSLGRLWRQYRAIREIAEANGAHLYNATAGGELDELPRVRLEDVVAAAR